MIRHYDNYTEYTCFMYETPYRLKGADSVVVRSSKDSIQTNVLDTVVEYTCYIVKDGRKEDLEETLLPFFLCPEDKNELVIFLTKKVQLQPVETLNSDFPQLFMPDSSTLWSAKQHLLQLHNEARDAYGDGSNLDYNMVVDNITQGYAEYIALNGDYQHTTVNKIDLNMRFEDGGYPVGVSVGTVGENLAIVPFTGDLNHDVEELFLLWKTSEGHWLNILDTGWDTVGIGIAVDIVNNNVFGVVNFSQSLTNEFHKNNPQEYFFVNFIGYEPAFQLSYSVSDINENHNLDLQFTKNVDLVFSYEAPAIPALSFLGFYANYQNTLIHQKNKHVGFLSGIIREKKEDSLQIAGKKYTHVVVNWDSFSGFCVGGYFFCAFSLDNYKGDYPPDCTLSSFLPIAVYCGKFLETSGLTGGRILSKTIDFDGFYRYNIAYKNIVLNNVLASDYTEYMVGDYVVLSKTSQKFESSDGFNFISQGRENSPKGLFGYIVNSNFTNSFNRSFTDTENNSIDTRRDDYKILPFKGLPL